MAQTESQEPEIISGPPAIEVDMDEGLLEQATGRLHALSLYSEEGAEYTKDTFNPSTLFNDKTQAEWFGNIVKNRESDALKSIVQSAQKPSKFLYLMVGLVGFLAGLMLFAMLSGGLGIGGGSPSGPNTTHYLPPPPSPSASGGFIGNLRSGALWLVSLII